MVEVQAAVRAATDYLKTLFPDARDLRLEEVEVDGKGAWDVTLSYLGPADSAAPPAPEAGSRMTLGFDARRTFKIVKLDPAGRVKAVRIRPIVVG
jgi:hypothetical protein